MCGPEPTYVEGTYTPEPTATATCPQHGCVYPNECKGYTCDACGWTCPEGTATPPDVDYGAWTTDVLPTAELRAMSKTLRQYQLRMDETGEHTVAELLEQSAAHLETACDAFDRT